MKFRFVNLDSLQTIRPYAHEGVVTLFRKLDVGQVGNTIIEEERIAVAQLGDSHFAVIGRNLLIRFEVYIRYFSFINVCEHFGLSWISVITTSCKSH